MHLRARTLLATVVALLVSASVALSPLPDSLERHFSFVWNTESGIEAVVSSAASLVRLGQPTDGHSSLEVTFDIRPEPGALFSPELHFSSYVSEMLLWVGSPVTVEVGLPEVRVFDHAADVWIEAGRMTLDEAPWYAEGGLLGQFFPSLSAFVWRIEDAPEIDLGRMTGPLGAPRFLLRVSLPIRQAMPAASGPDGTIEITTFFTERHFRHLYDEHGSIRSSDPGMVSVPRNTAFSLPVHPSWAAPAEVPVVGASARDFDTRGGTFEVSVSPLDEDGSPFVGPLSVEDFAFSNVRVTNAASPAAVDSIGIIAPVRVERREPRVESDLAVLLALDSSGSMQSNDPERLRVRAARLLLERLGDDDRAAIIDFGPTPSSGMRGARLLQGFTSNRDDLERALSRISAGGGTPLFSSLLDGLALLEQEDARQRVIVVMTDGRASRGDAHPDEALAKAAAMGATIFTLGLGQGLDFRELQRVAATTGGTFAEAREAELLAGAFDGLGRAIREGRTVVTGRGYLEPPLFEAGTYVLSGDLITTTEARTLSTPFSFTLDVAPHEAPSLPLWITLPHPRQGTVQVFSDLPADRASPMNLQGLAGQHVEFHVRENGVPITDQADATAYLSLLLDVLNRRGLVTHGRAHSSVRDTAGPPVRRAAATPYDVPHLPISRAGTTYVFEGGAIGLPGIEARGLDDMGLRTRLWRDAILSIVLHAGFTDGLTEAQLRAYEEERLRTTSGMLEFASTLGAPVDAMFEFTAGTLEVSAAASKFVEALEDVLDRPDLAAWAARALDQAYVNHIIWRNHGQTTIGMFTDSPRYTFFQRFEGHLGDVADGLTVAAVFLKVVGNGLEALSTMLAANAEAEGRLRDLELLAEAGPCRWDRQDDPAFCAAIGEARTKFDALQRSIAAGLADAYLSAADFLDYGALVASIMGAVARHHGSDGLMHHAHGLGATVFTWRQFHSISNEGAMLRRAHLLAQLDHWLATDGHVPDPREEGSPGAWAQRLRWADLHAYTQWAYFAAMEDAYTAAPGEGLAVALLHWLTTVFHPDSSDAVEYMRQSKERAASLVLADHRTISDKLTFNLLR